MLEGKDRMKAAERQAAWEGLGVVEDWLAGGIRVARAIPVFPDAPIVLPRPPSPEEGLAAIAREVEACRACRLCEKRKRAVPGQGPTRPLAMVVGEGPGAEEDERGLPFVGPAGQLLDKMLASIGLDRATNCFIANVVKCRPPQNRDPAPDEREACLGYLRRQIALLRPKAILCAGQRGRPVPPRRGRGRGQAARRVAVPSRARPSSSPTTRAPSCATTPTSAPPGRTSRCSASGSRPRN